MNDADQLKMYWNAFEDKRFTKADLWQAFGFNAFPGFPTPEFMSNLALETKPWIEPAPGPRGGAGWKLSAAAVDSMRRHLEQQDKARIMAERVVAEVKPALGRLQYVPKSGSNAAKIIWTYSPPAELPGYNINGDRRPARGEFSFKLPATSKVAAVQRAVDHATSKVMEYAERRRHELVRDLAELDALLAEVK